MQLTDEETLIFNDGERLIPGITHDSAEVIRHKSSYRLFRKIVANDLATLEHLKERPVRILELGCGTGHGTLMLADLPEVTVTAVDVSAESIGYAREHYAARNVEYIVSDGTDFVRASAEQGDSWDFVVTRHALEHIVDGIGLPLALRVSTRMLVNVPYREPAGNPYHLVDNITEQHFAEYPSAQFLYEGLDGVTHTAPDACDHANSILCIGSEPGLPDPLRALDLPFPAWQPSVLEELGLRCATELDAHAETRSALRSARAEAEHARQQLAAEREAVRGATEAVLEHLQGQANASAEVLQGLGAGIVDLEALRQELTRQTTALSRTAAEFKDDRASLTDALTSAQRLYAEVATEREELSAERAALERLRIGLDSAVTEFNARTLVRLLRRQHPHPKPE